MMGGAKHERHHPGRRMRDTSNPYKIVQLKDGRYAVEYKDYPHVGIPDSWGTKAHATAYMAALLGLTVDEMRREKV